MPQAWRSRALLTGVAAAAERARLLRLGFGDVAQTGADLDEIEARGARVLQRCDQGRLKIVLGALTLDLTARDGFVAGRRLALHPREFALLWRLGQVPGQPVNQADLLADVWHLPFQPGTNSLAVHVSRTRAKLRQAGLEGLLVTVDQSYLLDWRGGPAVAQPGLDEPEPIGEDALIVRQERFPCARNSKTMTALPLP